ncbi:MAG: hypothetical protein ACK5LJ_07945 [Paracoccus sp. (in: a-proteobacteria)]
MIRIVLVLLAFSSATLAQPAGPGNLLPLHELVKIANDRFEARILAAKINSPEPFEYALGTDVVQELVLLTPQGDMILMRLDGETGRVLDIRGRDLGKARRQPGGRPDRHKKHED